MGTLTGLFNSTRQALLADQAAISTTATNISNQNTSGYTKRTVTWTQGDTVQISGLPVDSAPVVTITSQRDRVLDRTLQQATDTASSSSTRLAALTTLQGLFTLNSSGTDSSGIQAAISGVFTGISAVAADPTGTAARQTTLAATQTLATSFNRAAAQLSAQTTALNAQVSNGVTQVNTLVAAIAFANSRIANTADTTSSLEDERSRLVTELSGFIGLQQTTKESNGISLSTTDGTLLVDGENSFALHTASISGTTRVLTNANTDITSVVQGGSIGGSIRARDSDLPVVASQLDTLAYTFAAALNTQNQAGLTSSGTAGSAIFSVGASVAGAAATISVALSDPAGIAAASTSEGAGGGSNANALLALQTSSTVGSQTFDAAFGSMLSGLGTTVSSATTDSTADAAVQTQLSTQRDSISGVSLDEEASNLTQYQRSYQAAAKLLSILDQILAAAINLGTETPVS